MAVEQRAASVERGHPDGEVTTGERGVGAGRDRTAALAPRLIPVALSALLEGLGQAYNRQPVKAAGLVVAGLGLSTASGLNTWLIRRVFGAKGVTIGSERIRPWLLAGWAATYAFSLLDAWVGAAKSEAKESDPSS